MSPNAKQAISVLEEGQEEGTTFAGDEGLTHSLISGNEQVQDDAMVLQESLTLGLSIFNPDMLYEQIAKNFSLAKQMYGEKFLQAITGEDPNALQKNVRYPEYQRQCKEKIKKTIQRLRDEDLINEDGVTDKGVELASASLYLEELDDLQTKGLGEKIAKEISIYGDAYEVRNYKKHDRYKDIALKQTVKVAIRRSHKEIHEEDLRVFQRHKKGHIEIIYALDASGSMKGEKIRMCKKAGIALAYHATKEHDDVGLIVFGSEVETSLQPTRDFNKFLNALIRVKARKQTDIAKTIEHAITLFSATPATKHLVLITDAMPTTGDNPEEITLEQAAHAKHAGITISVVGINVEPKGLAFAQKLIEIGRGKLYAVEDIKELDHIILKEYARL